MELAIISSGSNLGNRLLHLKLALDYVKEKIGTLDLSSNVYQTAAWGKTDQPDFLNQVFGVYTDLNPNAIMDELLKIELLMGRKRVEKWGPRSIDLDLLYCGNKQIQNERLTLPHPEIANRRFILTPLCENYSTLLHPILRISQQKLLESCKDEGVVSIYKSDK